MIQFHKLIIEGFLSFPKKTVIDFDKTGIVGVRGANGSGKSAMFEALVWCLFDRTIRGVRYKDDVISNSGDGRCRVSVEFTGVNDVRYEVVNTRGFLENKPGRVCTVLSGPAKTADFQPKYMEDIFGGYETFMATSFFHGKVPTFSEWSDMDKKRFISKLVNLEFLDSCRNVALSKYDEAKNGVVKLEEKGLTKNLFYEKCKERKRTLEKVLKRRRKTKRFTFDVKKRRKAIASLDKRIKHLEKLMPKLEASLKKAGKVVASSAKKVQHIEGHLQRLRDELRHWKTLSVRLKRSKKTERCKRCGMLIIYSKSSYSDVSAKAKLIANINTIKKRLEKEQFDYTKRKAKLVRIDERVGKHKLRLSEWVIKRTRLYAPLAFEEENQRIFAEENKEARVAIKKLADKLTRYEEGMSDIKKEVTRAEQERDRYQFWVEGFGREGIPSLILDSVLPQITDCANKYLSRLTDGSVRVALSPTVSTKSGHETDRLFLEVMNENGGDDYNLNSSGERKAVDFCIMLALRKFILMRFPNHETSLIVFDEALDSIDGDMAPKVVNMIQADRDLTKHIRVYIITHREQVVSFLPDVLTMQKRNRQSKIIKGDNNGS